MTIDLAAYRLYNQHLSQADFQTPSDVVNWCGAVQSQDFAGGKWAVGLRTNGVSDADVEGAFSEGTILRTHMLRPTWHFVSPADIRWMLALTAPRVRALLGYNDRQLGLDRTIVKKSNAILEKTLRGGRHLTRLELASALQKNKINTDELRLTHLVMHAELDAVICSGARRGKQFTYALLEERVPPAKPLDQKEATIALTRRYFNSHGPATIKDFVWWSGLTTADARLGLDAIQSALAQETIQGETYWFSTSSQQLGAFGANAYFLPNYDEYTVGYTDRSAIFDSSYSIKLDARGNFLLQNVILVAGQILGTWKRTLKKNSVDVEATLFRTLRKTETHAVVEAAERYAAFLNLPFTLTFHEA